MGDNGTTHTDDREIAELREEVRRLREAQEKHNGGDGDAAHAQEEHRDAEPRDGDQRKERKRHPVRNTVIAIIAVALGIGGVLYWLSSRHYEDTDDALVDGHI